MMKTRRSFFTLASSSVLALAFGAGPVFANSWGSSGGGSSGGGSRRLLCTTARGGGSSGGSSGGGLPSTTAAAPAAAARWRVQAPRVAAAPAVAAASSAPRWRRLQRRRLSWRLPAPRGRRLQRRILRSIPAVTVGGSGRITAAEPSSRRLTASCMPGEDDTDATFPALPASSSLSCRWEIHAVNHPDRGSPDCRARTGPPRQPWRPPMPCAGPSTSGSSFTWRPSSSPRPRSAPRPSSFVRPGTCSSPISKFSTSTTATTSSLPSPRRARSCRSRPRAPDGTVVRGRIPEPRDSALGCSTTAISCSPNTWTSSEELRDLWHRIVRGADRPPVRGRRVQPDPADPSPADQGDGSVRAGD